MNVNNYKKFLEEITISGNPGVPGEGDNKSPNDKNYLSDVERRAKDRLGITPRDTQRGPGGMPSEKEMELGSRIMGLLNKSLRYTAGKEDQLSELANRVFMNIYSELVDRYEIELDIKVIKPGRVKQFMDDSEEDDDMPTPPEFKEVVDEDIRNEVHKRKLANLIIQGEAKNTKHILHSDDVKEGLDEIYGEEDAKIVFDIWDEISKTADKLDWIIPTEIRAQMMEMVPDGLAGACSVGWKPKEVQEDTEEEEEEESTEEWSGDLDEEDMYDEEEDVPSERFDGTPIIRARGVDFPMLLHEAVKGLFEVLSLGGIPEDEEVANIALSNTGLKDEPEDWKYGPEIASDLRDFVNENSKINKYPNIREELYKMMIDRETMSTEKFLSLMRGILSNDDSVRPQVDKLIDDVIKNIEEEKELNSKYDRDMEDYNRQVKDYDQYSKDSDTTMEDGDENDENEIDTIIKNSTNTQSDSDDYSTWSTSKIRSEIDNALDDGDYSRVELLSKYLKESKIYSFKRKNN
jgi:hypothetical protein